MWSFLVLFLHSASSPQKPVRRFDICTWLKSELIWWSSYFGFAPPLHQPAMKPQASLSFSGYILLVSYCTFLDVMENVFTMSDWPCSVEPPNRLIKLFSIFVWLSRRCQPPLERNMHLAQTWKGALRSSPIGTSEQAEIWCIPMREQLR